MCSSSASKAGEKFDAAARALGWIRKTSDPIARDGSVTREQPAAKQLGHAFNLKAGTLVPP